MWLKRPRNEFFGLKIGNLWPFPSLRPPHLGFPLCHHRRPTGPLPGPRPADFGAPRLRHKNPLLSMWYYITLCRNALQSQLTLELIPGPPNRCFWVQNTPYPPLQGPTGVSWPPVTPWKGSGRGVRRGRGTMVYRQWPAVREVSGANLVRW